MVTHFLLPAFLCTCHHVQRWMPNSCPLAVDLSVSIGHAVHFMDTHPPQRPHACCIANYTVTTGAQQLSSGSLSAEDVLGAWRVALERESAAARAAEESLARYKAAWAGQLEGMQQQFEAAQALLQVGCRGHAAVMVKTAQGHNTSRAWKGQRALCGRLLLSCCQIQVMASHGRRPMAQQHRRATPR